MNITFEGEYDRESLTAEIVRGSTSPLLGWYSPAFLTKRPSSSLVIKFKPTGNMTAATIVEYTGGKPFPGLGILWRGY